MISIGTATTDVSDRDRVQHPAWPGTFRSRDIRPGTESRGDQGGVVAWLRAACPPIARDVGLWPAPRRLVNFVFMFEGGAGVTVLVVDDSYTSRYLLHTVLEYHGYHSVEARTAALALGMLADVRPG